MEKGVLQQFMEAVTALAIALVATLVPCGIFGAVGTVFAAWAWDLDTFVIKLISWSIFTGALLVYALVDRVTLRIYDQLNTYTYRTGRIHLSFYGLVGIMFYGWGSTDMRPSSKPRPRAYYYKS